MQLTIIYDNNSIGNLKSGWGFSCLVEKGDSRILFDTGCDGEELLYNLNELNINITEIRSVVISHQHWDHYGGLFAVLHHNKALEVFLLASSSQHFKEQVQKKARVVEVKNETEISKDIYLIPLDNNPDEQSLIVRTAKGTVVVVGCSHPGVDKILEMAKKHGKIYAIVGGFHGFSDIELLKDIPVLAPCHCTQHIKEIKDRFPKQFKEAKAGFVMEV